MARCFFKSNTSVPVAKEPVSKSVNVVSETKEKVHEVIMGTQKYYDTVVPVFDTSGKHIAAVRVGFPAVLVSEKATGMVTYSIFLATISFLLAIPLLIAALSKWVTKPLGNLLTVIEDVRAKGAGFEEEVEIVSHDEIGRLSIAFNEMMENLRNSHQEIQRQNEILEERIEERTAELRMDREALRKSEEKYRTILQSIEEGYLELDQEGNVIFTNESACKILGYSRTELNASNYQEFTDEKNFSEITNILSTVFDTGIPNRGFESVMKRKDGSSVPIDGTVLLMRDSKQQTTGCRMTFRDITERRQAHL